MSIHFKNGLRHHCTVSAIVGTMLYFQQNIACFVEIHSFNPTVNMIYYKGIHFLTERKKSWNIKCAKLFSVNTEN